MNKIMQKFIIFCLCLFLVFGQNLFLPNNNQAIAGLVIKKVSFEQSSNYLFVANQDNGKIYVLNAVSPNGLVKTINIGSGPSDLLIHGNYLLVALSQNTKVGIIDLNSLSILGYINTPKMPYKMGLDGSILYVTTARNNGSSYQPFVVILDNTNILSSYAVTINWPSSQPYFGNEHILIDPISNYAYLGNVGYSPDNISKYSVNGTSTVSFILKNSHGALGSNGKQFIFNGSDYSKIYLAAGGVSGYTLQIVNSSNLTKNSDLSLGAYPNAVAIYDDKIFAGKSAYYDSGDIKVYNVNNVYQYEYSFDQGEELLDAGLFAKTNIWAATDKYLYKLGSSSSEKTKIFDFVNEKSYEQEIKDGDLIKYGDQIYQIKDGKRYVVPNISGYEDYRNAVLDSWGLKESSAIIASSDYMTTTPLGGNVNIKPNTYKLKLQSQPEIYNIEYDNYIKVVDSVVNHPISWKDYVLVYDTIFSTSYILIPSETVITKPDLVIESVKFIPTNPEQNKSFTGNVEVVVVNQGNKGTDYYEGIKVGMSLRKPDGSLVNVGSNSNSSFQYKNNLGAGGSIIVLFPLNNVLINSSAVTMNAYVDNAESGWGGFIDESNENNNILSKLVNLSITEEPKKPDIVVSDEIKTNFENNILPGDDIYFYYDKIENNSDIKAGADVNVKWYVDGVEYSGCSFEYQLLSHQWNSGTGCTIKDIKSKSSSTGSGNVLIEVKADPDNKIDESNENNNILSKLINLNNIVEPEQEDQVIVKSIKFITKSEAQELNKQIRYNASLTSRIKGRMLLRVERGGEIWYVNPKDQKKYSVTFANALPLFENLALGITDADLTKIPVVGSNETGDTALKNRLRGWLLLQVEKGGAIWYVDKDGYRHNVTWNNLMDLFRKLALGITDNDLNKIYYGGLE
ncbi:MAG: CARDB domain-containing protein [Patescibacteria group bacterium]